MPFGTRQRKGRKGSQGAKRITRDRETERHRDKAKWGTPKLSATTHYLFCPFMTFYALWYPRMKRAKRAEGSEKVKTKVRVNAPPFMPFYDVLCPLVPDLTISLSLASPQKKRMAALTRCTFAHTKPPPTKGETTLKVFNILILDS